VVEKGNRYILSLKRVTTRGPLEALEREDTPMERFDKIRVPDIIDALGNVKRQK